MTDNPDEPDQNIRFICYRCKVKTDEREVPPEYKNLIIKKATISCNGEGCTHNPFKCQSMRCYTVKITALRKAAEKLLEKCPREKHQIPICTRCQSQNRADCNAETNFQCTGCKEAQHRPCLLVKREKNPSAAPNAQQGGTNNPNIAAGGAGVGGSGGGPAQLARANTGGSQLGRPEQPVIKQEEYDSAEERDIVQQEAQARRARQAENQAGKQTGGGGGGGGKRTTADRPSSTPSSSGGSAGPSSSKQKEKKKKVAGT